MAIKFNKNRENLEYLKTEIEKIIRKLKLKIRNYEEKIIISDRYADATVAYQGYGRGIDLEFINMINKRICGYIKPDITFFLDLNTFPRIERM